jgi:DNA mismatch repair protein MSH6
VSIVAPWFCWRTRFCCSAETDFIPNDVAIGGEAKNLTLLTGPNVRRDSEDQEKESTTDLSLCMQMAGKSTLLRMTCTAVIMAQRKPTFRPDRRHMLTWPVYESTVGCYVPAAKARISPIDAIYSRMGANDFIFANASTFKVEMDDCNKILQKVSLALRNS